MEALAPDRRIEEDVRQIVGGNFTPDALGPDRHREVIVRVRARPEEYLRVFESLFLGTRFDARSHSHLYLPSFLSLVADVAPDRVRSAASRLLQHYDTAMSVADDAIERALPLEALPEDTSRMVQRLDTRRRELRALLR